jgi:anaerobic magnesium-protoporphyrin IX monomethyl ester cyclase
METTKNALVTLIELPPTLFGNLNGDVSFDIFSQSKMPARAIHVLEGVLRHDGWTNTKSINPIFNEERGKLTAEDFKRVFNSDFLLISSITRTSPQSQELARMYKLNNPGGIVIAGGPDPTFRLEDWLNYVDVIVIGEGEKTLIELMNQLIEDPKRLEDICGLAFKREEKMIVTKPRELLTSEELSQLPHPFYDEDIRDKISSGVIETSRGCPNNCNFCTVTKVYGRQYRGKSIDYILEELKRTKDIGNYLFFSDDNLIALPGKSLELLDAIAKNNLNKKYSGAQTTIRIADKPELMKALKKAKINALCIGIESINDETLKDLGKPYTAEQNKKAIKIIKKEGFWIHGMMMTGGDGDTKESLKETLKWAKENLDSVQFFSPIPIPGTPLYDRMEEQGRILTKEWYLYDGSNVIIRPKNFTPYELQKTINGMYEDFYSFRNGLKRLRNSKNKALSLGILTYAHLKGKKMIYNPQSELHLEFLKAVS